MLKTEAPGELQSLKCMTDEVVWPVAPHANNLSVVELQHASIWIDTSNGFWHSDSCRGATRQDYQTSTI